MVSLLDCKPVLRVIDVGRVISGIALCISLYKGAEFQACHDGIDRGIWFGVWERDGEDNMEGLPGTPLPDWLGSCIAGITCSEEGSCMSLPPLQKGLGLAICE